MEFRSLLPSSRWLEKGRLSMWQVELREKEEVGGAGCGSVGDST
jgi:hypothetical protein